MTEPVPPLLRAVDALKAGDRQSAAALLEEELRSGRPAGDRWRTVSRMAAEIGEINIAIEAARRSLQPTTLNRFLYYWGTLANYGRSAEAIEQIERLAEPIREHPAILHFRGTIAGEQGRFLEAEELFRRALAQNPDALETWFALAMIKTFELGDPDLDRMVLMSGRLDSAPPEARARLLYALGKAWDDCGEFHRAFECFKEGAAIRRKGESYDAPAARAAADRTIRAYTRERMGKLHPSQVHEQRSIFVTGLPRSGTTLVQQILSAHSQVSGGDEVNLFKPALIPTIDFSFDGALAYQGRAASDDPWGDVARDYAHFIGMRFRVPGLVIDKTVGQSSLIGLLLHSLPNARIVWLRRNAEDNALSCFRTYFTAPTPWSWSPEEIANHFRIEDRLFEHWRGIFGDRILVVPYESLVREPAGWIKTIAAHVGLAVEVGMERFHESERTVRTASVKQVRSPVSSDRIGTAGRYSQFIEPFRVAYQS